MITRGILSFLLCLPLLARTQDKIVLTTGESILGKINILAPAFAKIHYAESDKTEKIPADKINYLVSTSTGSRIYYYSRKIYAVNSKAGAKVHRLLQLVLPGKIKTYSYDDVNAVRSMTYYYIEKDSSGLIFIGKQIGFIDSNDEMTAKEVKKEVMPLFEDNPDLLNKFSADPKNVKRNVISRYVKEYNQVYNESNPTREE